MKILLASFYLGACGIPLSLAADPAVDLLLSPGSYTYAERHRVTYQLGRNLGSEDIAALLSFLALPPAKTTHSAAELRSLKNNVADAIIAQKALEPRVLKSFLALIEDEAQDEAWREFLLQKLPELALRFDDGEIRTRVADFLRVRSESTEYIFAGTALISLQRLGVADTSLVASAEIARRAQAVLDNSQQANACKLAALQVLGGADPEEGRRRAVAILGDQASPIMLKVSALATLGEHGRAEDSVSVKRYTESPDYRLRTAAKAAVAKLVKRPPMPAGKDEAR